MLRKQMFVNDKPHSPNLIPTTQSNFFAAGCKIMQHYVTHLYSIMQHYVIPGDISPHFRRLIAVNGRFSAII